MNTNTYGEWLGVLMLFVAPGALVLGLKFVLAMVPGAMLLALVLWLVFSKWLKL